MSKRRSESALKRAGELSDRELDIWVAQQIMGWVRGPLWGNGNGEWIINGKGYSEHHISWDHTPAYSSKISAAMQVVEKIDMDVFIEYSTWTDKKRRWLVRFGEDAMADDELSLPKAICLAALAASDKQKG